MKTFFSNLFFFIVFASVAYYFDMPWITILGFGFWVALWLVMDAENHDTREEIIQKINFLLRGDADYIYDLKDKIKELESELNSLRYELDNKQDKQHYYHDDLDDDFRHLE